MPTFTVELTIDAPTEEIAQAVRDEVAGACEDIRDSDDELCQGGSAVLSDLSTAEPCWTVVGYYPDDGPPAESLFADNIYAPDAKAAMIRIWGSRDNADIIGAIAGVHRIHVGPPAGAEL